MSDKRLYVNGGGKVRVYPAIGVERRYCARCGQHETVTITDGGEWETWTYQCGHVERYKVR